MIQYNWLINDQLREEAIKVRQIFRKKYSELEACSNENILTKVFLQKQVEELWGQWSGIIWECYDRNMISERAFAVFNDRKRVVAPFFGCGQGIQA
jgi:hypothetical protein